MRTYKQTLIVKFELELSEEDYIDSLEMLESEYLQETLEDLSADLCESVGADSAEVLHLTFDMSEN